MEVVILDFETTGLSCDRHRVIEIGAAIIDWANGEIKNTFETLCNPPLTKPLPKFITQLTGITDSMLKDKPSTANAMLELYSFIGTRPIICHNATFDSKFLIKEMSRIDKVIWNRFFCTLKLSRRLLLSAGSYKLSKLKIYIKYQSSSSHKDHRALSDVLVTIALWKCLMNTLGDFAGKVDDSYMLDLVQTISGMSKTMVTTFLSKKLSELGDTKSDLNISANSFLKSKIEEVIIDEKSDLGGCEIKSISTIMIKIDDSKDENKIKGVIIDDKSGSDGCEIKSTSDIVIKIDETKNKNKVEVNNSFHQDMKKFVEIDNKMTKEEVKIDLNSEKIVRSENENKICLNMEENKENLHLNEKVVDLTDDSKSNTSNKRDRNNNRHVKDKTKPGSCHGKISSYFSVKPVDSMSNKAVTEPSIINVQEKMMITEINRGENIMDNASTISTKIEKEALIELDDVGINLKCLETFIEVVDSSVENAPKRRRSLRQGSLKAINYSESSSSPIQPNKSY